MSVSKEEVYKIANLARIEIPEERLAKLAEEFNGILGFVDQLTEVDCSGVSINYKQVQSCERQDNVTDGGYRQEILSNAPESAHGMFSVPKVIE